MNHHEVGVGKSGDADVDGLIGPYRRVARALVVVAVSAAILLLISMFGRAFADEQAEGRSFVAQAGDCLHAFTVAGPKSLACAP
jgi:hypothetical protein